jgi:hypothetical protein
MKAKKIASLVCLVGVLIMTALVAGCSDKTFSTTITTNPAETLPKAYAPLEPGLRVSFAIVGHSSQTFDIEIGDSVVVDGNPGFEYRQTDNHTGVTTTSYRYLRDNALFESTSVNDPGVRILEGPFIPGHTWDRNDTWSTNDGGAEGGNGGGGSGGGTTLKIHAPSIMTIAGFEDIQALDGAIYSRTLKVAWPVDADHTNYYWYALGIGMIKYEEGFMAAAPDAATTIALMTDYQRIQY